MHLYLVKQFKIESSDIFQILVYFQNFDVYFINRYLTVWGFTIVYHSQENDEYTRPFDIL